MAQVYLLDSGLMLAQGESAAHYQNLAQNPDWDPTKHGIADTGQTFDVNWVPKRQVWFYVPARAKFYQSERRKHALLAAAEDLLGQTRWEEIQDALEEQGPLHEYLADLDLKTLKRKARRARDKGLITTAELQSLADLLP